MDGYTAALQIKESRPETAIIAQTAYALEHEIERYSGNAFDAYITKPINEEEFKKVLKQFMPID
jgi:CheY-like chemotaxis protein